jgi:hypothetical protein
MTNKRKTTVNLDDGENWMVTHRKEALKRRGWSGTIEEWQAAFELLKGDPLDRKPPVKSLTDAKRNAK